MDRFPCGYRAQRSCQCVFGVGGWFGHFVPFQPVVEGGPGFPGTLLSQFRHFLETQQSLLWQSQPLPGTSAYDRDLVRTLASWLLAEEGGELSGEEPPLQSLAG